MRDNARIFEEGLEPVPVLPFELKGHALPRKRDATSDPVLRNEVVLHLVRKYAHEAKEVRQVDGARG